MSHSRTGPPGAAGVTATRKCLSVVIPVYNGEATICSLLDELLPQCDVRCELIVVDDCSTDATPVLLEAYRKRGVRCLQTQQNSGPATARNLGAAAANGETLLFFDSDDVPAPVLLCTVLARIEAMPEAAFGGYLLAEQPMYAVDRSVLKHGTSARLPPAKLFPRHAYARELLLGRRLVTASSVFVRRSLFAVHGGFAKGMRLFEDPELFVRLSAAAPFVQIPEVLAIYRVPDAPPAARTQPGAANRFIQTVRLLARHYGAGYQLVADVFAIRMAVLARASGATVRECRASLHDAGVGIVGRITGAGLLVALGPAVLDKALRLYRRVRRRRANQALHTTHATPIPDLGDPT